MSKAPTVINFSKEGIFIVFSRPLNLIGGFVQCLCSSVCLIFTLLILVSSSFENEKILNNFFCAPDGHFLGTKSQNDHRSTWQFASRAVYGPDLFPSFS